MRRSRFTHSSSSHACRGGVFVLLVFTTVRAWPASYRLHDLDIYPFGMMYTNELPDKAIMEHLSDTTTGWAMVKLLWQDMQPSPDPHFNFAKPDALKRIIQSSDVQLVGQISMSGSWALPKGKFPWQLFLPNDLAAYARWLQALVERYDGDGTRDMPGLVMPVKVWQIEPKLLLQWQDSQNNLEVFLQTASRAIRAADPSALIVLTIPPPRMPSKIDIRKFFQNPGNTGCFDILAGQPSSGYPRFQDMLNVLTAQFRDGRKDKSIWFVDLGRAHTPKHANAGILKDYSDAQLMIKCHASALASGVEVLFWGRFHHPKSDKNNMDIQNPTFFDQHGKRREAMFAAYQRMTQMLRHAYAVERLQADDARQFIIRFDRPQGPCYLVWDDRNNFKQSFPIQIRDTNLAPRFSISTVLGCREYKSKNAGKRTIMKISGKVNLQGQAKIYDTQTGNILLENRARDVVYLEALPPDE